MEKPKQREDHERPDQRHRHGEQRDEGGAEALQEHEHDDDDEDERLEQRLDDLLDPLADGERRVERHHVVEVVGEALLGFLHQRQRLVHGVDRVRVGQLVDGDDCCGRAVQAADLAVALRAELDARHVAHPYDRSVDVGAHDDVAEFLLGGEASLRAHRVGELLPRGHRLAADLAGRVHRVLLLQRVEDLAHRDAELGERVGVDPEAHGVVSGAEDTDLTDAGHARHRVVDVDVRVVGEEERVVRTLRRVEREQRQRTGGRLLDGDAVLLNVERQLRLGLHVAHLHQDLIGVGHRGDVEVDLQRHRAVAGVVGVHVDHVVHALHLLLDRRGNRVCHRDRIGADVGRLQLDLRRGDVGEQGDGELHHGDDPHDHHDDRDDHRHDGPVDEELGHGRGPRGGQNGAGVGVGGCGGAT